MRILPKSLFSRLVLVLLSGLIVAQGLSVGIQLRERGQMLLQASGMQSAQRIADIVKVLDPLTPDERRRMVGILSAPPLTINLVALPERAVVKPETPSASASVFEALLRRMLGERPLAVAVTHSTRWQPPAKMRTADGAAMRAEGKGYGPGMHHLSQQPGMSFLVQVPLDDRTAVVFDSRQAPETLSWPYRMLGSLVILLAAVIILSLIAVRWATRPLNALAEAADELGRNLNRAPLPETGPLEVQRAARALNTMQARLIGYIDARTRILAAMSHDLKTPITRLRLRSELLDDLQLRAKFSQDLAEMEAMVSATLDFMRGSYSDEPVRLIDCNALLQTLQADAQETDGTVTLEGNAREPYAGKPHALKRCLTNLIDNAIKYGNSARIVIDDSAERMCIRVSDEGPGIPEAELEQVFEPFYRVESSRSRETGGTGLGLPIARAIAESHGGSLSLRNHPAGGLEATLTLPRTTVAG